MPLLRISAIAATVLIALAGPLSAAPAKNAEPVLPQAKAYETDAEWRQPVQPFRIGDRTWYIGTQGLSALLVKTDAGAVLIDGGLPQAADMILARMRELGVAPSDLKYILHSHAHIDHAGPIAAIQRATGARVVSNAESAALLARGGSADLHFSEDMVFPPVHPDRLVMDGEVVELGGMRFTVHFTPGHTPGSMSWTWDDKRERKPLRIAYVDSLSAPGYQLAGNPRYPHIVDDYRRSFGTVAALPCDVLITPHPDASGWTPGNTASPHPQPISCADYAGRAATRLDAQLKAESEAKH
ncbi:subclass B3 metallo-beta-lactamase [Lysobacter sp. S4-A87]|uniref:subclass B3 metallo-beta-lactamase n=1 Tax=Lysobacter sp. S4-A87 TaxID=2925843 RepID=UPI001F52BCF3|nr:subclass B3 metallo-beta-lactamase [Lysobacter sp. S4-A87]UNK49299.1 subclass B3 metallo-beta-lactamase [Lysobacter sp. S4-A87]